MDFLQRELSRFYGPEQISVFQHGGRRATISTPSARCAKCGGRIFARCAKCGAQCAKCGGADLRGALSAGARGRYEALGQHYRCYAWKIFAQSKHAHKRLGQPALTLPPPPMISPTPSHRKCRPTRSPRHTQQPDVRQPSVALSAVVAQILYHYRGNQTAAAPRMHLHPPPNANHSVQARMQ